MRGFEIVSRIHEGPRSVVLRALSEDGQSVVLKRPRASRPGPRARAALEAEHALLRQFSHPAVVRAEGLVQDGHRPVLVMRDAGRPLAEVLAEAPLELTDSLQIATAVAEALGEVHGRGFVHRDVHPGNILIDARGGAALADLGLAAPIEREARLGDSNRLIGQLRYVAPEQTGRTRGRVDERSDLYALGAVLFEMLTGAPPFPSVDPAELVHAHLARPAPAPRDVNPRLPAVLDDLVGRLLAKRPADRYQSASGLAADLRRLVEQARTAGDIGGFELGADDDASAVRLPDQLYGRAEALEVVDEAVHRSGDGGRVLLRIEGAPGAGKSALVEVLGTKLADRGRRMLVGRFSGDRADEPLVGFVEILRTLLQEALTLDEATLEAKRGMMRAVIGDDASLLSSWIPELGPLLHIEAPPPQLDPAEAGERLVRGVGRIIAELASSKHPATLVLENVEAADAASLRLLQRLLTAEDLHYLLIVVTHRPEAAVGAGPLAAIFEAATARRTEQWVAKVSGLDAADTTAWLSEALRATPEQVAPLAARLYDKTAGNPLALSRLLPELVEAGHVRSGPRGWVFDLDAIAGLDLGEDVVELLLARMDRLPTATVELLRFAACLGARFDLVVLAAGLGRTRADVVRDLAPAADAHVVQGGDEMLSRLVTCSKGCLDEDGIEAVWVEFADERFRDAAYTAMAPEARAQAHLRFGRWMRDHLGEEAQAARGFELVAHFEAARGLVEDLEERRAVARLMAAAADRAVAAVAWQRAVDLYAAAFEVIGAEPFEVDYELAFRAAIGAEGVLLFVRHIEAPTVLPGARALVDIAREDAHRITALSVHVILECRSGRAPEALVLAADAARPHGFELLPDDPKAALAEKWRQIRATLDGAPISSLAKRPMMQDELHVALLGLVRAATLGAYICRRELVPLVSASAVLISARYGSAPMSSLAFGDFSVAVIEDLDDVQAGLELADVAVEVAESQNAHRAGARMLVAGLVEVYRRPLSEVCELLEEGLRLGRETGSSLYQGLGSSFLCSYLFLSGQPLDRVTRRIDASLAEMSRYLGDVGVREADLTQRMIQVLRGERSYPWDLRVPGDDEVWARATQKNPEGLAWGRLLQARLALMHEDPDAACEHVEAAESWNWREGHIQGVELGFHRVAAYLRRGGPQDLALVRAQVAGLRSAVSSRLEVNYGHRLEFAEGALAWLGGQRWLALERFEAALRGAERRGLLQDQALIAHLAARCLEDVSLAHVASAFWVEACHAYEAWGATALVARIDAQLDRAGRSFSTQTRPAQSGLTSEADAARVDLDAVIRAAQALAHARSRDALVQTLLQLVVENAGAERAALVLEEEGEWHLVARLEPEGLVIDERPLERVGPAHAVAGRATEEGVIPVGIINYVTRAGVAVVIGDARSEGRFGSDPYVARRQPRALVAAPIERQGQTVGVLYLENNLSPGAFDGERLEVVEVLAAQAAISMEQARLYEELERKVEARTRDLAEKNRALEAGLEREQRMASRLVIVEKMASLGNLVAGVAHELNTPIGAVLSSADTLRRGLDRLEATLAEAPEAERRPQQRILSVLRDNQSVVADGGERVAEIVRTLRVFARLDEAERQKADLHEGLESTLKVLRHRLADVELVREYGALPPIDCYPNELNQVFMNLLINAAQAVASREGAGRVTLRTGVGSDPDHVWVEVHDDGPGIPEAVRPQIFDPGFTTRGVGVGLGLGLSICFSVVEKHGGRIEAAPGLEVGARLRVTLPVSGGGELLEPPTT